MITCDDETIRAAAADPSSPLVVTVTAPWCKFCKLTEPHLERLSAERAGQIRFAKVDNDEHPDVGSLLSIKTLPLVVLFKDGVEAARRGSGDYDQLTAWLSEHGL